MTQAGTAYTVTFGGNLSGINLAQMTSAVVGGTTATVTTLADGIPSTAAACVLSAPIAMDPVDPRIIYLGTGETDNSTDSFYGTGLYKSIDSGRHWTLVTDTVTGLNPFAGMGISKIIVDDNSGSSVLYVASGDGGARPERSADAHTDPGRHEGLSAVHGTGRHGNGGHRHHPGHLDRRLHSCRCDLDPERPGHPSGNIGGVAGSVTTFFRTRPAASTSSSTARSATPMFSS